ncbi:hypothetical protein L218DRAFT_990937 [Marasmius fiardii PR-910]|nr:hypothetical protein L218DRAFT_990937 [Marasmius fiardii PR-910]
MSIIDLSNLEDTNDISPKTFTDELIQFATRPKLHSELKSFWKDITGRVSKIFHSKWLSLPRLREAKFTVGNLLGAQELRDMPRWPAPPAWLWRGKLKSVFLKIRGETEDLEVGWLEWLNAETELAVRVVEGDKEREVEPAVGLKRSCWKDPLSV